MPIRTTGLQSGLDTESIIRDLVTARKTKVDTLKKAQTRLGWKQERLKELNSKIFKLVNSTLSDMSLQGNYSKKTTTISDSKYADVTTDASAMNNIQDLVIEELAKRGFITGGKITSADGKALSSGSKVAGALGIEAGSKFEVTAGGKTTEITVDGDLTINGLVEKLKGAGVDANFDATNQRLFIGAKESGAANDFTITASNDKGTDALNKLGILTYDETTKKAYEKYANMDAAGRQKLIDAKTAELLKSYTAKSADWKKSIEALETTQIKLKEEYELAYGDTVDISDDTARAARKTEISDKVTQLNEALENAATTESDKEVIKAELKKLNGEQSFIDGYEKNKKSIGDTQLKLDNLYQPDSNGDVYLNADGTAGARLNAEAEGLIQEKIDKAVDIINNYSSLTGSTDAHRTVGLDARIKLNGATFTGATNTISVNGLNITCKAKTENETVTLTTKADNDGIYDMIKNFIKNYNEVINEIDKLYNAESSKGYEPLTSEEKEAMSDSEVEEWEKKIKDSLLRRDSNLSAVSSTMKETMMSGIEVKGQTLYLSDFGINTLGYFNAAENEKSAYHINGDEDDDNVKNEDNDLKALIDRAPSAVIDFFSGLSKTLYSKMDTMMRSTKFRSSNKMYDDKKMKEDYDAYTTKIKTAEKKLLDYENKWYKKFAAMETALAKLQSNSSAITGLLGG